MINIFLNVKIPAIFLACIGSMSRKVRVKSALVALDIRLYISPFHLIQRNILFRIALVKDMHNNYEFLLYYKIFQYNQILDCKYSHNLKF